MSRPAAPLDAVQQRFIEALARRAEGMEGRSRDLLAQRVAELRSAHGTGPQTPDRAGCGEQAPGPHTPGRGSTPAAPLRELVRQLDGACGPVCGTAPADDEAPHAGAALAELKTVRCFRDAWLTLSADRRLAQSLRAAPANAGPLNSERLIHRALSLMRELSPAYLHRFMSYTETLRWLDAATGGMVAEARDKPHAAQPPRTAARRSR
jgi:hypothetical protein